MGRHRVELYLGDIGAPKGVVYHHRGAYLMALGTGAAWRVPANPVYLLVVPMFHCNGWGHPWLMAMLGGTMIFPNVPAADRILAATRTHGVTHFGAAPILLQMLAKAKDDAAPFDPAIRILTAGAPPPPTVLEKTRFLRFVVMQVYGLTETYGHVSQCLWQDDWDDLGPVEQAEMQADQCNYVPFVDEAGGMLNDPVAIKHSDDRWWNSIADSDTLPWITGLTIWAGRDVRVFEPDAPPLAVQGPKSDDLMARGFGDEERDIRIFRYKRLAFQDTSIVVARSGYSKQGGYEIYVEDGTYGMPLRNARIEVGGYSAMATT